VLRLSCRRRVASEQHGLATLQLSGVRPAKIFGTPWLSDLKLSALPLPARSLVAAIRGSCCDPVNAQVARPVIQGGPALPARWLCRCQEQCPQQDEGRVAAMLELA